MDNMMDSDMSPDSRTSFRFDKRIAFFASQDLASIRSKAFVYPQTELSTNIWKRKALDFTPKLYRSIRLPQKAKRIERASLTLTSSAGNLDSFWKARSIELPEIFPKKEQPKFEARFRPPDALGASIIFVKTGKYPSDVYKDPKPHDFRQYEDNIPDIVTTYERDPGNLNLKLQNLSAIDSSRSPAPALRQKGRSDRFDTFKPAEPKWDPKLILPEGPWPPKSASYTRHRRRRGVYSALMERVEEKLDNMCKNVP
ncbi:putative uncharacterized protein C7orf78 homolog [Lepisosteus oculatus]|uniref:putative uncharacterized protein C7orf78 homolog n=1 Tax=Lepisosteus oculatus TaxID=7918 RepID=UPI0007402D58|nr:PREDICTED: uncharacterized protein LOC107078670 [Lepisosteus oculatus]